MAQCICQRSHHEMRKKCVVKWYGTVLSTSVRNASNMQKQRLWNWGHYTCSMLQLHTGTTYHKQKQYGHIKSKSPDMTVW